MILYSIKDHEVPLFPVRYLKSAFGYTRSSVLRKEERGQLPPANFRNEHGNRLYSIEDLAMIDYVYKEIWPYKQGVKVPDWVKELLVEALAQTKKVVVQYGKSQSEEDWKELDQKYTLFSRFRVQLYIESWRRKLLDVDKFFPELVDEE
ncbi:MAG: hypothetical protein WDA59_11890 [Methanofastidiosum sp.]|jgi:hypothetical protein